MGGFERGAKGAVVGIVGGFITSVILNAFISSGLLNPSYVFIFSLISVIGLSALILAMPSWGVTYLLGWIFGVLILLQSGFIGSSEIFIYLGIPIVVILLRVLSWFK